jgi:LuxR family transcriptional regulator, maltose regulon positive regulatory protein
MLATMILIRQSGIVVVMTITAGNTITDTSKKSAGVVVRRELLDRLSRAGRVTEVSGPAGSGKSVLLRSWIDMSDLAERAARVPVREEDSDPLRFWTLVTDALRGTAVGSALVRPFAAADGWSAVERLLADLGSLRDRVWLVIDDVHVLGPAEVSRQLEAFILGAPAWLRFVLASRPELCLGLHRLRLEGELTEIRADALRFSQGEARVLFESAGVQLSEPALALLHERTEGWAAGLRLASLSLAGHPDPDRFAAEFCGSERTVAEYLLAEVLERQDDEVRRLLLRTSVLERVSGPLADLLTGGSGGERILHNLEQAGAFVVALDARRSWFRYHRLLADLLKVELRHAEPGEPAALHGAAARWFAEHGFAAEAIRHAQAGQDWELAGSLLAHHWLDVTLNGQPGTAHQLIPSFPADAVTASAELSTVAAAAELMSGSLDEGARYLSLAAAGAATVPVARREHVRVTQAVLRLYLARQRGDLGAVAAEIEQLARDVAQLGMSEELRALVLISLGVAELWSLRVVEAEAHLDQAVALARRIGRPFLEFYGLAHWGVVASFRSPALAVERGRQAIELARRHGWSEDPRVAFAYPMLAAALTWQGELGEAERWLMEGEWALQSEAGPDTAMLFHLVRGSLEISRGQLDAALAALRGAARLSMAAHPLTSEVRAFLPHVLVRLGQTAQADAALTELAGTRRDMPGACTAVAALRLAQNNPRAAIIALAPVLGGSAAQAHQVWLIAAFLLEASARDALGEREAAGRALERALGLAEPDGLLFPFLLHPAPELLERHARQGTAHPVLIRKVIGTLGGRAPAVAVAVPVQSRSGQLPEPLSQAETRVLRLLQTSLSAPEIARELYVSVNTVRTHMRHVYDKLGAHRRLEAIDRARALGLLTPVPQRA